MANLQDKSGPAVTTGPRNKGATDHHERLFYDTLAAATGFESLDRDNVAAQILRAEPALRDKLSQGLLQHCQRIAEVTGDRRAHTIDYVLTDSEKSVIKKMYPQYLLEFTGKIRHEHAFSASTRDVDERFLVEKFKALRPSGHYDVLVKDIGGNPGRHLARGRIGVHSCFPCLSPADAVRHTRFLNELAAFRPSNRTKESRQVFNSYLKGVNLCSNVAEECRVTAPFLISVHSAYDMGREKLAAAMIAADAHLLRGSMIFHPDVLVFEEGIVPDQNMSFKRYTKNGTSYVRFYHAMGGSTDYTHEYSKYLELIKTLGFTYRNQNFSFEIDDMCGGRILFSMYRHYLGTIPPGLESRTIALGHDDKLVVYYWRALNPHSGLLSFLPFVNSTRLARVRLVVEKKLFERMYTYATTLTEGKFVPQNIINAGHAYNQRQVIGGTVVAERSSTLTAADIVTLSHVIYLRVYIQRYVESQTMTMVKSEIDSLRQDKSLWSRLVDFLTAPVWAVKTDIEMPPGLSLETTVAVSPESVLSVENLPLIIEKLPSILTIEQDIQFTGLGGELFPYFSDEDDTPQTPQPLPPPQREHSCAGSFTDIPVAADGNCFFHALRAVGATTLDPVSLRQKLLASSSRWNVSPYLAEEQKRLLADFSASPDRSHWANETTFLVAAQVLGVRLCVHLLSGIRVYGEGNTYHMRLHGEHVVGLREYVQLPPCLLLNATSARLVTVPDLSAEKNNLFSALSLKQAKSATTAAYRYSGLGNCGYICRAGVKLAEIFYRIPRLAHGRTALDICSGPGGFTQFLVSRGYEVSCVNCDKFVPMNYRSTAVVDVSVGDGDLLDDAVFMRLMQSDDVYPLVVADGCPPGNNRGIVDPDHFFPLLSRQIDLALQLVDLGGNYVQKFMFPQDARAVELLIRIASNFRELMLIRPCSTRPASDEFYVVALDHVAESAVVDVRPALSVVARDQYEALREIRAASHPSYRRRLDSGLSDLRAVLNYVPFAGGEVNATRHSDVSEFYKSTSESSNPVERNESVDPASETFVSVRPKHLSGRCRATPEEIDKLSELPPGPAISPRLRLLHREFVKNELCPRRPRAGRVDKLIATKTEEQPRPRLPRITLPRITFQSRQPTLPNEYPALPLPKHVISGGIVDRVRHLPVVSFPSDVQSVSEYFSVFSSSDRYFSLPPSSVCSVSCSDTDSFCPRELESHETREKTILGVRHHLSLVTEISDYDRLVSKLRSLPPQPMISSVPTNPPDEPTETSPQSMMVDEYLRMLQHVIETERSNFSMYYERRSKLDARTFSVMLSNVPGTDIGFGRVTDGRIDFIVKPRTALDYVFCFDGDEFLRVSDAEGKDVLVSELTEKFFEVEFLAKHRSVTIHPVPITLVQAAAGCGKTTDIVAKAKVCRDVVVLAGTTEGRDDIERRLDGADVRVRTIQSFLLSPLRCSTLLIDEAMMQHPGMIVLAAHLSGAAVVSAYGDRCQIPFVNRARQFQVTFSNLADYFPTTAHLMRSYRCPVSVAARLHDRYERATGVGMTSVRDVRDGESIVVIPGLDAVPKAGFDIYLTFKQSEKQTLLAHGYPATTVHSFQGKEARHVAIVRLSSNAQDELYLREEYALVAITRHTVRMVYFTMCTSDALARLVSNVPSENKMDECLDIVAGGTYDVPDQDFLTVPVAPRGLPVTDLALATQSVRRWKDQLYTRKPSGPVAVDVRVPCDLPTFLGLAKRILSVPVFLKTAISGYAPFCVFSVMNRSGMRVVPRPTAIELPEVALPHPVMDVPAACTLAPVEQLQCIVNHVFPGCAYVSQEFDTLQFHYEDLDVPIKNVSVLPYKDTYTAPKFECLRPRLTTAMPRRRPTTMRESLVALLKRNANVPDMAGVVDIPRLVQRMTSSVIAVLVKNEFDEIQLSAGDIAEWLREQPPAVAEKLLEPLGTHEMELTSYDFMIKRDVKPDLTNTAAYTYSALQTVLSHPKTVNAITCPMIRRLKERVLSALPPNILFFTDVTTDEFCEKISRVISPSFTGGALKSLEVDISKYDKSQGIVALIYECRMMMHFGVPAWFVALWFRGHVATAFSDMTTGIRGRIAFQRKSGDASTYLGNTLFLLAVLLSTFEYSEMALLLCSGDDSLILGHEFDRGVDVLDFNLLFNLETKFLRYQHYYFCSKYLFSDGERWRLVPDPVKVMVKLGRHDLMNWDHCEEYRISYADNVRDYSDARVSVILARAVRERYCYADINMEPFLSALFVISSPEIFPTLFFTLPSDVLCHDVSRPSLDN